jgi:hypothetical protein
LFVQGQPEHLLPPGPEPQVLYIGYLLQRRFDHRGLKLEPDCPVAMQPANSIILILESNYFAVCKLEFSDMNNLQAFEFKAFVIDLIFTYTCIAIIINDRFLNISLSY